jgi:hypothetical protein
VTGRQGRRCRKLLDDLKERTGCSDLKEKALDCTMWRSRFGRGFWPVVRQTTKWMNVISECSAVCNVNSICCINMVIMVVLYAVSCVSPSFEHIVFLIWPPHNETELSLTFSPMISLKWYVAWLFVQVVNGVSKTLQKGDVFLMVCGYTNTGAAKVCSEWQ